MINKSEITVILNVYKRLNNLQKQINAINEQTIKPKNILIWQNKGNSSIPKKLFSEIIISENNFNFGVWARFAFALNVKSKYICIFDDDTIPGKRWFENCLNTMKISEGLLGTRGLKFRSKIRYSPNISYGWDNPNSDIEKVDIVGHCWFFKREWLASFWRELPPIESSNVAGEDIHFSYTLQKYLGLNTYVPPHPLDDKDLWGSNPYYAYLFGNDDAGISKKDDSILKFNNALKYYCRNGFKLCIDNDTSIKRKVIIGGGLSSLLILKKLVKKYNWLNFIANKFNKFFQKLGIYF